MKLLKSVWAEMTIAGKFKGSLSEFAVRNVDHGNKVYAGKNEVKSVFEMIALDPNQMFIDETTMTCCGEEKTATAFVPDIEWPKKEQFEKRYKELMKMDKKVLVQKVNETSRLDMSHIKSEPKQEIVYYICEQEGLLKPRKKAPKASLHIKTASVETKADFFFNPLKPTIACPHCKLPMKEATLVGSIGALFCPNCRHCDWDDKVKSTVNAGSPSVDKSLQFKCIDSGNCQIAN